MATKHIDKAKALYLRSKGVHYAHHVCKDVSIVVVADGIRHGGILDAVFHFVGGLGALSSCLGVMAGCVLYFGIPLALEVMEDKV